MFLVCGEALYDLFVADGDAPGHLRMDARPGGSPFNVAIGLSRLGAPSALLTGMSGDMLGARLASVLDGEGVGTEYLVATGRRTTLSVVGVDGEGVPSYIFYGDGSADCGLTEADLPALGSDVKGLHFGSYSTVVQPVADAFMALAKRHSDLFLSLDPNVRPTIEPDFAVWRARVDALRPLTGLVKVSDEDLGMLYPDDDPVDIVRGWARDGPALVVLTRGAEGVVGVRGEETFHATPPGTEVVDTVGAGDTFMAALLAGVSREADPAGTLRSMPGEAVSALLARAATAAAITCSRRGADLPTAAELDRHMKESA